MKSFAVALLAAAFSSVATAQFDKGQPSESVSDLLLIHKGAPSTSLPDLYLEKFGTGQKTPLDDSRMELLRAIVQGQGRLIRIPPASDHMLRWTDSFENPVQVVMPRYSMSNAWRIGIVEQPGAPDANMRVVLDAQLRVLDKLEEIEKRLRELENRKAR